MYLTRLRGLRGFCAGFAKDSRSTGTGRGSTGIKASGGYGRSRAFYQQNQYMEKTREQDNQGISNV